MFVILMCSPSLCSLNIDFTLLVLLGHESSYKGRGVYVCGGGGEGREGRNLQRGPTFGEVIIVSPGKPGNLG